jgi:hypothetical protein
MCAAVRPSFVSFVLDAIIHLIPSSNKRDFSVASYVSFAQAGFKKGFPSKGTGNCHASGTKVRDERLTWSTVLHYCFERERK